MIQLIKYKCMKKERCPLTVQVDTELRDKLAELGKQNRISANHVAELGLIEFVNAVYDIKDEDDANNECKEVESDDR